jgi:integrase
MRIRLKGVNRITKRLADGTLRTYWYAWKGGPPLRGEPGTPEFIASYNEAVARKATPPRGVMSSIIRAYQETNEFLSLGPRTRSDYIKQIKIVEKEFGDFPLSALTDRRTRGIFKEWRDRRALDSRRQADYGWTVMARILSVAMDRGLVAANPCERGGRLYRSSRVDKIWTFDDEEVFLKHAPAHLHLPLLLALWTGQRQGDLLRMPWSAYDGSIIRLRPHKLLTRTKPRGVAILIPVGTPLKTALDEAAKSKKSPIILVSTDNKPWTEAGFRSSWGKACGRAGLVGVTFNDLRGTAVTRLALVGCTEPEIATITGHSLKDVCAILDAHYLHRDRELAWNAIRKLEMGYAKRVAEAKTGTDSPN